MTRLVGPEGYGVYAAAYGIFSYLTILGDSGIKMYLLRVRMGTPIEVFHQAFSWLLIVSLVFTGVVCSALGVALHLSLFTPLLLWTLLALCLGVPLAMTTNIPMVLLERALNYRAVASIEISSQLLYYTVGIVLALKGYGAWAFVGAFWAGQVVLWGGAYASARYRPRWVYDAALIRDLMRNSLMLASVGLSFHLRQLLPALVLLPLGGAQAVGHYAIAQRILNTVAFVRDAIARLSVPLYARAQDNPPKLLRLGRLSAQAQLAGTFVFCFLFLLFGAPLLEWIFGHKWDTHLVLSAFSIMSVSALFFVIFGAQNQLLIVRGHSRVALGANVGYMVSSILLGYGLVSLSRGMDTVIGFCLALSLAHFVPNWLLHAATRRYLGGVEYGMNLVWAIGLGLALLVPIVGYWGLLGLTVLLLPSSRTEIREVVQMVREARRAGRAQKEPLVGYEGAPSDDGSAP